MKVWDADAIIMTLKQDAGNALLTALILRQEMHIGGTTITELLASPPRTQAESAMLDALTGNPDIYLQPGQADFRAAGLWLREVKVKGTKAERRNQRSRLTLDALLAALAWRRGAEAVTLNAKDFRRIAEAAGPDAGVFESPAETLGNVLGSMLGAE